MRQWGLLVLFFVSATIAAYAQSMIQVKGVVYDADSNQTLDSVTVIVKHSSRIARNNADGSFSVFVKNTDTLMFGIYGYKVTYLCFKDSTPNKDYLNVRVNMFHFKGEVKEVVINQIRTQSDIRYDIQNLAYRYALAMQRADPIQSPITAIYDQFSHKSQTKQLLVDYEFQLARNKLVYQLLDIYNKQGIIDLPYTKYKLFVEFMNPDWSYLIAASDYDLAVYIRQKIAEWMAQQ